MARTILTSALAFSLFAVPSFAAEPASSEPTTTQVAVTTAATIPFATAIAAAPATPLAASVAITQQSDWYKSTRRPAVLPLLYASSVLLQGFDAYSTLRALNGGAVEANPLMKGATSSPLVFVGIKAAVTTASILAAEKMWRNHNRAGAIVTMVVSNGMMALVAQHNASVLSGLPR